VTPCKTRALGCKLDGLHPTLQRWHRTRTAPTPGTRCHHERAVRVVRDGPFACWAMCSEHMQGDAWGTSVARARAAPPERGRAYGARARGSRSPRRSGRWGQPITVAQGDREAAGARGRVREAHKPALRGCRPLESGWRSKDARAVRRGAIGKVPARATRWWPTLP